ncbi:MAG: Sir2 family NAD-dependent protein deacetylase [Actinomycetota bacterium]|nr:Sir2 family NAD-dependent protein deacetylase [Actinomycetota bacterium]
MTQPIARVAASVAAADQVTVLTGAGISTESGIPDYRGPNGAWTTNPASMRLVDIDAYLTDPQVRRDAWQERLHHAAWTASPGPGHSALVDLERTGKLRALITQNIDGLHQAAGSSPGIVRELHGTIRLSQCLDCGHETPMREQLDRVVAGELDPPCRVCGGIQKSATVAFGQSLDPDVLHLAREAAAACQVFLAVGTSLQVQPAARLCDTALEAGAQLVIVNAEPTPYDHSAAAIIRGSIGEVLPMITRSSQEVGTVTNDEAEPSFDANSYPKGHID